MKGFGKIERILREYKKASHPPTYTTPTATFSTSSKPGGITAAEQAFKKADGRRIVTP